MATRRLAINPSVLVGMLTPGFHCYAVEDEGLPPDTAAVAARVDATGCLVLTLESDAWQDDPDGPNSAPYITPVLRDAETDAAHG